MTYRGDSRIISIEGTFVERLALFQELCGICNALETLTRTALDCAMRDALESLVVRLDELIDTVVLDTHEEW
jgi:hypothetical protein